MDGDIELNEYGREINRGPKMRFVKAAIEWAEAQDFGTYYAGDAATWISDNVRGRLRIGKITAAKLIGAMPGWFRDGATITKLRPGQKPLKSPSDGMRAWVPRAPTRGTLASLRDSYNAWAEANGYGQATSWALRPVLEADGYKVITRPHNVAVYGRDEDII